MSLPVRPFFHFDRGATTLGKQFRVHGRCRRDRAPDEVPSVVEARLQWGHVQFEITRMYRLNRKKSVVMLHPCHAPSAIGSIVFHVTCNGKDFV